MTEFVVYEDSPFAEYLNSINEPETTVKVTPPTLNINGGNNNYRLQKRFDISSLWRQSFLHDAFSVSLSKQEESAFEEKFKYLIVTSPLLSEVLSVHNHKHSKIRHSTELPFQSTRSTTLGVTTNLVASLAILLGAEKYFLHRKIPIISLSFSTSTSLFFLYRHKCRTSIRQLYQMALSKVQEFIDHSDTLDTKVHRVLITIQEIELVSRGYRLSTPLSPISRIEQNSKQRKCITLRNRLSSVLRSAFITYEEGIIDLMDVVNKSNLATLYDMYNVHSIASLSALNQHEDEVYSLDQLKKLAQLMHLKRRECMVHLLALQVMTENHDSLLYGYKDGWKAVIDVLKVIVDKTEHFANDITDALEAEFYKPASNEHDKKDLTSKIEDARLKKFVHKLSSLEQQLRTMEAKIYLCNEDVKQLNSDNSSKENKDKLRQEYMTVQQGIESLLLEWNSGKLVLESYLDPPIAEAASTASEEEQQQVMEQPLEESEGKGIVLNADDVADILNLPLASKASVFEAIADVVEKNGKEKSKKTRQERIEEMKLKRAVEADKKASRLDSQTMVHELKSVLHKRVSELESEPEVSR